MSVAGTLGCTMEAPADAAYAVLPVGVDIIRPVEKTPSIINAIPTSTSGEVRPAYISFLTTDLIALRDAVLQLNVSNNEQNYSMNHKTAETYTIWNRINAALLSIKQGRVRRNQVSSLPDNFRRLSELWCRHWQT